MSAGESKYILHYFNARGRGELIRYILLYTGVPFEDRRMSPDEWIRFKPKTPLGQLPVLECLREQKSTFICQSGAIIRKISSIHGLNGKTPEESGRADEAFESLREVVEAGGKVMFEQDPSRKEHFSNQLKNEIIPRVLGFLEKRVQENGGRNIAGGDEYTFADLFVAQFFDNLVVSRNKMADPAVLQDIYPGLAAIAVSINNSPNIKAYLAMRPHSDF